MSNGLRMMFPATVLLRQTESTPILNNPAPTQYNTMSSAAANTDVSAIVFFDGVCGLCNHTVNFLMDRDTRAVLKFAPLQGTTAENIVPEETRKNLNTFVFARDGRLFYRSGAMARILMHIGGRWRILGGLMWLIPWPVRDIGYRIVAALRYRMFGKTEACRMPSPEERSRFLD